MNGCIKRNCPCGIWTQCHKYNNWKYKQYHNDKHIAIINSWYIDFFKVKYEHPDGFGNG